MQQKAARHLAIETYHNCLIESLPLKGKTSFLQTNQGTIMAISEDNKTTVGKLLYENRKLADSINRNSKVLHKLVNTCDQMAIENRKQRERINQLQIDISGTKKHQIIRHIEDL